MADDEEEYILIEVALDSGAGDHVADRADAPGYAVEESRGSKRGQKFKAAGGHTMPNQGQATLNVLLPGAQNGEESASTVFQVASVTRPLWSVSKICDSDYTVLFNKREAKIFDDKNVLVCTFERQGGLYVARMKLRNPKYRGFARQGKPQ